MKILICGKGGSGKSTVVTLLALELRARGYHILVVDVDESNLGLFRMLGFDHKATPLIELIGGKRALKAKMGNADLLPQRRLGFNDIPPEYKVEQNDLSLVSIGKIHQSYEGCACPMGVLGREFLEKLHLETKQCVIVDMEAGIEHFGRGVGTSADCVLAIAEPSQECMEMAVRIRDLASEAGINNTLVILNKIPTKEIAARMKSEMAKKEIAVLGIIPYDIEIFLACLEGHRLGGGEAAESIKQITGSLLATQSTVNTVDKIV